MSQPTSGSVLAQARERKGLDLTTVARKLRIRPDILRAIEANDFDAMPPRGYTRNMINAYARLLGLNPTEIVDMYLDEAYAYEVERARDDDPRSRYARGRSVYSTRSRARNDQPRSAINIDYDSDSSTTSRSSNYLGRALYDDRTQFSRDDYGVARERENRSGRSERDFKSHHSGYSASDFSYLASRNRMPRQRSVRVGLPIQYQSSRASSILNSKLPLIIAGVVVVALIVVIAVFVFGGRDKGQSDDVSALPVSGITDTTQSSDESEETDVIVEVAPTSAHVNYAVKSGDEVYAEFYLDDEQTPMLLNGPVNESIQVTGEWTIATYTPELIDVTVDGVKVELVADEDYAYMYVYTVDFPKILEEWNATHASAASRRSAANAAANAAATNAQSSSTSSSGAA